MSESIVGKKSFEFAVQILNFYKKLSAGKKEYILSNKLHALLAGTVICNKLHFKRKFENLKNPATEILKITRGIIITTKRLKTHNS